MLETLITSFTLVAVSEMGDKTQLLAFALAARYRRPLPIMAGIFVATILNHGIAAGIGSWVSRQVSPHLLSFVVGGLFIAFGIWALIPDRPLERSKPRREFGPFLTTIGLFFIAEMGDKTQLATLALGARFSNAFLVTVGTTLGMVVADGFAVFFGDRLSARVPIKAVRGFSAALFFAFGAYSLYRGFIS